MNNNDITGNIAHYRTIINTHRKRLRVLQEQAAGFGGLHVPAHVVVEIDEITKDIASQERLIEHEKGTLRHRKNQSKTIDVIRGHIKAGNKDKISVWVKKLGNLEDDTYDNVKKLISGLDSIHLQSILKENNLDINAEYLNEHLAWLLLPQRSKELSIDLIENFHKCIKEDADTAIRLESIIIRRIEDEYQLSRRPTPPPYFTSLSNEIVGYYDAFDLISQFYPEDKNQIITVFGDSQSGKTETLKYFQQANPAHTTFYVFLDADGMVADSDDMLSNLQYVICKNLLHIFVRHPFTWSLLNPTDQSLMEAAIRQYPSILESEEFESDPINMIKPWLRDSPDEYIASACASLLSMLQSVYISNTQEQSNRNFLRKFSDIIFNLKYSLICVSIDNLPTKYHPFTILRSLNGHFVQYISLRIAYRERPLTTSSSYFELNWDFSKLSFVFETMLGRPNRFDSYHEVREQLIQQVTVPGDFRPWLTVFDTLYPGETDITPTEWDIVYAAMYRARDELSSGGVGWSDAIGARAIEALKEARP